MKLKIYEWEINLLMSVMEPYLNSGEWIKINKHRTMLICKFIELKFLVQRIKEVVQPLAQVGGLMLDIK